MRSCLTVAAVALLLAGPAARAAEAAAPPPKEPSLYVQCDGNPEGESDAATAARLLALSAVVGLLLPPPEAADPAKRKTGVEGIAACDGVINSADPAKVPRRRVELLLARAIHRIEAKDYPAAIVDVALARQQASDTGLMADPYFVRSFAVSFDQLEAAALLRKRRFAEAAAVASRQAASFPYSTYNLVQLSDYADLVGQPVPETAAHLDALARALPLFAVRRARVQMNWQQFAEAARSFDDMILLDNSFATELTSSRWPAEAALAHALAGNWTLAAERAAASRRIDQERTTGGKPEESRSGTAEILDLYDIARLAHEGNAAQARRLFSGRSKWLEPPLGAVLAINTRLREGARPEELVGTLARPSDIIAAEARDERLAQFTAKDNDNKSLYALLVPHLRAGLFESKSSKVWKTDKSKILIVPKDNKDNFRIAFWYGLYGADAYVRYDAFTLHTALMARKEGRNAILTLPYRNNYGSVMVRTGNSGDADMPASLVSNADAVIAALAPVIPDPATLKARRATRKK